MTVRTALKRDSHAEAAAGRRFHQCKKSCFINLQCLGCVPIKHSTGDKEYIELYELPSPDNMYCVGAWYPGGKHDLQIWPIGWFYRNKKDMLPPPHTTREQIYNNKKVKRKTLKRVKVKRKTLKVKRKVLTC